MNPSLGVVLVHGYTGSAQPLARLAAQLELGGERRFTTTVGLHDCVELAASVAPRPAAPRFDGDKYVDIVRRACEAHLEAGRELVLIGHSTGGSLALEALASLLEQRLAWTPLLVVLAATPGPLDSSYAVRWHQHLGGRGEPGGAFAPPTLADMGRLARLVDTAAARRFPQRFPTLLLQGENDDLVPAESQTHWRSGRFGVPPRVALVPGAGHDPFAPACQAMSLALIERDIADAQAWFHHSQGDALFALGRLEPSLVRFFVGQPLSARHVVESLAGQRALDRSGQGPGVDDTLSERAPGGPVFLNVEVTTRCPFTCPHCARSHLAARPVQDMSSARFAALLGLVPTAARVTFAGLGEPLCHPELDRLVALSTEASRSTSIVTNGALLSAETSALLLAAGVDTVVLSLDAAAPEIAAVVRPGADLGAILENARQFTALARQGLGSRAKPPPELVVFTALGAGSAAWLPGIVDQALSLNATALVLSDLNFVFNAPRSLAKAASAQEKRAIRSAVASGLRRGLPILGVRALEELGHRARGATLALTRPDVLWQRSKHHTHCASPWQTLPVAVDGAVSFCDCRPGDIVGNVFEQPLAELWNGPRMLALRTEMRCPHPSEDCLACPRF